ncbi:hypothetical protein BCF74_11388 [Knoellia remsis]|uniref:Uncharacterized protein n=1 Tax=Knoellia remsis TaxID=407159 RepID=A0A2T0UJV0_9MICO|nr:hypothetical protein [Knoellia remsis]PRY58164.1 hypothetical protein BCF74_11388 [Knoellia remsis]
MTSHWPTLMVALLSVFFIMSGVAVATRRQRHPLPAMALGIGLSVAVGYAVDALVPATIDWTAVGLAMIVAAVGGAVQARSRHAEASSRQGATMRVDEPP